jgi:8-oxoguanine deaminase
VTTLLVKNADIVITLDENRQKFSGGGIFIRDNVIQQVDFMKNLPAEADAIVDAKGMAIIPGLINTHHHFFQSLFRSIPGNQDHGLFEWLEHLYPMFAEVDDKALYISSLVSMAELILSGCTTSSDHNYLYPIRESIDLQIRASQEIGLRFHPTRGSISVGVEQGGITPDFLVEKEEDILVDCQRLIEEYHDPNDYSMLRIGLAPCTPFTTTKRLMKETARMARSYPVVSLHTHVGETRDEVDYCKQVFNQRPVEYMEELGWLGSDVWWAHVVYINQDEIMLVSETETGVSHCPSSNMRLGSGISPVGDMLRSGVNVSIGVDGSASNDTGHILNEARAAVFLQRAVHGPQAMTVEDGIRMASSGGASVLGRKDIGSISPGKAADLVGINLNTLEMAGGAVHDPQASLLLCRVNRVDLSVINGKVVVEDGVLKTIDLEKVIHQHNQVSRDILRFH